jgi:quercetin dioxygenase-like cupin family protein
VLHVQGAAKPAVAMQALEGHGSVGRVEVNPMMVGDDMLMVEFLQEAGVRFPEHVHADHESIVYLLCGRMELAIGGQNSVAVVGDVWRHPVGVPHSSLALEDCTAVEVKSPPRQTWNTSTAAIALPGLLDVRKSSCRVLVPSLEKATKHRYV